MNNTYYCKVKLASLFKNISNIQFRFPKHLSTIEGFVPLFSSSSNKFLIEGGKVGCYPINFSNNIFMQLMHEPKQAKCCIHALIPICNTLDP
jgi:hypothetical protein